MFLCVYKIKKGRKKCIIIIHTRWYAKLDHIWYIYIYISGYDYLVINNVCECMYYFIYKNFLLLNVLYIRIIILRDNFVVLKGYLFLFLRDVFCPFYSCLCVVVCVIIYIFFILINFFFFIDGVVVLLTKNIYIFNYA